MKGVDFYIDLAPGSHLRIRAPPLALTLRHTRQFPHFFAQRLSLHTRGSKGKPVLRNAIRHRHTCDNNSSTSLDEDMAKYAYAPLSVVSLPRPNVLCCRRARVFHRARLDSCVGSLPGGGQAMTWAKMLLLDKNDGRYHLLPDSGWL